MNSLLFLSLLVVSLPALSLSFSVRSQHRPLQHDAFLERVQHDAFLETRDKIPFLSTDPCGCSSNASGAYKPTFLNKCDYWGDSFKWCYVSGGAECTKATKGAAGYWVRCGIANWASEKADAIKDAVESIPDKAKEVAHDIAHPVETAKKVEEKAADWIDTKAQDLKYDVVRIKNSVKVGGIALYGNWCGPMFSGGQGKWGKTGTGGAVDSLDTCCMVHDHCYNSRGYFDCDCDRQVIECAKRQTCSDAPDKGLCLSSQKVVLSVFSTRTPCQCKLQGGKKLLPPYAYNACPRDPAIDGAPAPAPVAPAPPAPAPPAPAPGWTPPASSSSSSSSSSSASFSAEGDATDNGNTSAPAAAAGAPGGPCLHGQPGKCGSPSSCGGKIVPGHCSGSSSNVCCVSN